VWIGAVGGFWCAIVLAPCRFLYIDNKDMI